MKFSLAALALLGALFSLAATAYAAKPDYDINEVIRCSVDYSANAKGEVTAVFNNSRNQDYQISLFPDPVSGITQTNGVKVAPAILKEWGRFTTITLPANGTVRFSFNPGGLYRLKPGEAYLVTIDYQVMDTRCHCTFPYVMPTTLPVFTSEWSKEVAGLQARLRFETEPIGRIAVFVEMKNNSDKPISITNQPPISMEVKGSDGKPIKGVGFQVMSGPVLLPQKAVIPAQAIMTVRVDRTTEGIPVATTLLAVDKGWGLASGTYQIISAMEIRTGDGWKGKIEIPSFDCVVGKR